MVKEEATEIFLQSRGGQTWGSKARWSIVWVGLCSPWKEVFAGQTGCILPQNCPATDLVGGPLMKLGYQEEETSAKHW